MLLYYVPWSIKIHNGHIFYLIDNFKVDGDWNIGSTGSYSTLNLSEKISYLKLSQGAQGVGDQCTCERAKNKCM